MPAAAAATVPGVLAPTVHIGSSHDLCAGERLIRTHQRLVEFLAPTPRASPSIHAQQTPDNRARQTAGLPDAYCGSRAAEIQNQAQLPALQAQYQRYAPHHACACQQAGTCRSVFVCMCTHSRTQQGSPAHRFLGNKHYGQTRTPAMRKAAVPTAAPRQGAVPAWLRIHDPRMPS